MSTATLHRSIKKQHLIDPEICIRCNTCEATCPVGAVTHDDNNYVVDPEKCNFCLDCISPCPTGSIDNWRIVDRSYSAGGAIFLERTAAAGADRDRGRGRSGGDIEAADDEAARADRGSASWRGRQERRAASAGKPKINLFNRAEPAIATVSGNFRLTDPDADNDVRHIDPRFRRDRVSGAGGPEHRHRRRRAPTRTASRTRSASIRSRARANGEKSNANNLSLTVKREPSDGVLLELCLRPEKGRQGAGHRPVRRDLPDAGRTAANILMICTGTGSAPFRGFTERRRRAMRTRPGA